MNAITHHNYTCLSDSKDMEQQDTFTCADCGETRWSYECFRWDECGIDPYKGRPEMGHSCDCPTEEEEEEEEVAEWNETHGAWVYGAPYQSRLITPLPQAAWRLVEKALDAHPEMWKIGESIRVDSYVTYVDRERIVYQDVILTKREDEWVRILSYYTEWNPVKRYDIDLSEEEWMPQMETMGPYPYPVGVYPEFAIDVESGLKAHDPMRLLTKTVDGFNLSFAQHSDKPRLVSLPPATWWASAKEQIEFALTAYEYPPVREGETVLLTERTAMWSGTIPYTVRYQMELLDGVWSPLLVIQPQRRCFLCYTYDTDYFPVSLPDF